MTAEIPIEHTEATNAKILAVSEDCVQGFHRHPFQMIAQESGVPLETVFARIMAMLAGGVIRRVRQTLLANKLAEGALVAWKIEPEKLDAAFEFMSKEDPFSGHVVTRSTDRDISGKDYRLWTTLKVPQGQPLEEHAEVVENIVGADDFILMPAHGIFSLGVNATSGASRWNLGAKSDEPKPR
ncbi:MAG: hypothetical protein R3F11_06500 [Verrucomicrobiales bacterium]